MVKQITAKSTLLFSTDGTPEEENVLTTDNNILVNPKAKSIEYNDIGNGALGNSKTIVNDDYVTAEFSVDIRAKSSGAAGVAPKYSELFKACGLTETIDADISVVYTPASSFVQGTAKSYVDDTMREVTGISGDFTFSGQMGEIPKFSFSLKGFTTLSEAVEENPEVALDTNKNFVVKSVVAVTSDGTELNIESFDFSFNAQIGESYGANIKEFYIKDYKPTIKIKAIKTKGNSTHWIELLNNTKKSIVITLGSGDGEIFVFTAPYCAPVDTSESDGDGIIVYERTWNCENSAGGDNFSITYK